MTTPPEPVFQDWLNNLSFVASTDVICPNTAVDTEVTVVPIDYGSGTSPVTRTFTNVLWEGHTSVEIAATIDPSERSGAGVAPAPDLRYLN